MNRLQVPSYQYPYVQLALDYAAQWTTRTEVLLEPGTYRGDLVMRGDVLLAPARGIGTVVIEAASATALTCYGRATVSGVEIKGEVHVNYGHLTVTQCGIQSPTKIGIAGQSSTVSVLDSRFLGGGLVMLQRSAAKLVRCRIQGADIAVLLKGSHAAVANSIIEDCQVGIVADEQADLDVAATRIDRIHTNGVVVDGASRGVVNGSDISRVDNGVKLGGTGRIVVRDTSIADCGNGVLCQEDATAELTGVRVSRVRGNAVFLSTTAPATVERLTVREAYTGLHMKGGRATLLGLDVEQVTDAGIALAEGSVTTLHSSRVRDAATGIDVHGFLTSCEVDGAFAAECAVGVQVAMSARLTWTNGTAEKCVNAGLAVKDRAEAQVRRVRIAGARGPGIEVAEASRAVVADCAVTGAAGPGVSVSDRSRATVDRCDLTGNSGPPLECDATSNVMGGHADDVVMKEAAGEGAAETGRAALGSTAKVTPPSGRSREELMAELDGLVGLAQVKDQVTRQIRAVEVELRRKESGLKVSATSRHLVFAGPPGTGKTTVARLYAQLLAALSAVRRGQLVEVSRSDLVEQWVGWSARSTRAIVEKALGGVLFIDEAYSLSSQNISGGHDFGSEVIDELVLQMENHREDLVVIVAGYADRMETFMTSNPGLATRFPRTITFPYYSADEVVEILRRDAQRRDYVFTGPAIRGLARWVNDHPKVRDGRAARNLLDRLREHQEGRLGAEPSREEMQTFTVEDIEALDRTDFG